MKKITSILLTVALLATMLTVFAVPASAEEEPTEIVPKYESFYIPSDGNYIIRGEYEVNALGIPTTAKGATLTIAKGAKVTVKDALINFGTINVLGTLILPDRQNNDGTIRVAGCGGGMFKHQRISNSGTGTIIEITEHNFENKVCTHCGIKGCETGQFEHDWDASTGICSFCGFACTHDWNATTGKCSTCGFACAHDWNATTGICSTCGFACTHDWNATTGKCSTCGFACTHEWDAATGKCSTCGFACTHDWNATTGKCFICGIKCTNTFHEGVCPDCGMGAAVTGSILSEGSLAIIIGVAALVIGLGGGFLLGKIKKKPALASGENTDEE